MFDNIKLRLYSRNLCKCSEKVSRISLGSIYEVKKEMDQENFAINKKISDSFTFYLYSFLNTMKSNFSKEDLLFMYKNLSTLKVKMSNLLLLNLKSIKITKSGDYRASKNMIRVCEGDIDRSIFHELLHMASAFAMDDMTFSWFHQTNKDKTRTIGGGINEGYTEVLNKRYFQKEDYKPSYIVYYLYVSNVEKIVGKETMEKLYLSADLHSLIDELSKYNSKEETKKDVIEFASGMINKINFNGKQHFVSIRDIINSYVFELENKKSKEGYLYL